MAHRSAFLIPCFWILLCLPVYLAAADGPAGRLISPEVPSSSESPKPDVQIPVGQTKKEVIPTETRTGAEIFGRKGGYIHPFLILEERYTDNLYNTASGKEDDFITSISPGVWLALPSNREKLLEITTASNSPGGQKLSRVKPEATRRFQSYLCYAPEFVFHANHSEHDSVNHKAEGMFQYNFNMGLSLDIVDQFNIRHEVNDNGIARRVDKYRDNLFNILAVYDVSEKLRLRVDYSNYDLDYDETINDFRDRVDNSFAGYLFYRITEKTSIFAEYEFAKIKYDTDSASNSKENRYYGGVEWDVTAKTKGRVKLGYIQKDFEASDINEEDAFSVEVQAQHNFNPKRALRVTGFRKYNESTMIDTYTSLSTGVSLAWLQRFTEKWSGTLNGSYTRDQYKGVFTMNGFMDEREDDIYSIAPALRYKFRDWLLFDIAYIYTKRDSNFSIFDYENNTVFLRADLSL